MFVHTHMVGSMDGETTLRQVKVQKNRSYIDFPPVAKDYAVNINRVDKSDRYGHNNSVTIRKIGGTCEYGSEKLSGQFTVFTLLYVMLQMRDLEMIGRNTRVNMTEGRDSRLILVLD